MQDICAFVADAHRVAVGIFQVLLSSKPQVKVVAQQTQARVQDIRQLCSAGIAKCPPRRRSGEALCTRIYSSLLSRISPQSHLPMGSICLRDSAASWCTP